MENYTPKILIIDDNKLNLLLVRNYLRKKYSVKIAINEKEAFSELENNRINLILLDIMMPRIDGFELCQILKKEKKYRNIPIIFLTAKTDIESIEKAFQIGGVDYITKPFNKEELFARIKTHLELEFSKKQLKIELIRRRQLQKQIIRAIYKTEEKERNRFSEEIHDGLGVLLSSIKLYLNTLSSQDLDKDEKSEIIKNMDEIATEAIITSKEIANKIHPTILTRFGLSKTLIKYIEKINNLGEININYKFDDLGSINEDVEIIIFRVISELINNTLKHANAKNIILNISRNKSGFLIEFSDDGIGFNVHKSIKKGGLGLKNIVTKIKSINGKIKIESEINKGSFIKIEIV